MPPNRKYLTYSRSQRFTKISAGFLGGFFVSATLHIALAAWFNRPNVIITSSVSSFFLWAGLMIIAFLFKNGWKAWGIYLLLTLAFLSIAYLGKINHPIIN